MSILLFRFLTRQRYRLHNYYSIADNISYWRWKFNYFMKYSILKTLGRKHKRTVGQILEKYRDGTDVVIPYKDNKGNEKQRVWYNGGFRCKRFTDIYEDNHYDNIPNTMYLPAPHLWKGSKREDVNYVEKWETL